MNIIDSVSGKVLAEIVTNHRMSIDDALRLLGIGVDDDGELYFKANNAGIGVYYEDLVMVYEV